MPHAICLAAATRASCRKPQSHARPFSKARSDERLSPRLRSRSPWKAVLRKARRKPSMVVRPSSMWMASA
eukprot:3692329-Lingulodinium_polyedra.AAC.1